MSTWEKDYGEIIRDIRKSIIDHHIKERQCRSFHFSTPSKGGIYAFSLTWTPGSMVLAGDLGEMHLTHYHAMGDTAVKSFDWVATSHPDYLLGKSDAKKVYDRDATWETIKSYMDDEVRDIAKVYRDDCYAAKELCEHKHEWAFRSPKIEEFSSDFDYMRRLNNEFGWSREKDLFSSAGRRSIREEVRDYIMEHDHDEVGRGLYNAGFDEYYGSMKWSDSSIQQITVMQSGAKMAHALLCQEYELQQAQKVVEASKKWYAAGHPISGPIWDAFKETISPA